MARNYSDWLKAYMEYASSNSEAPHRFHFWTGIATIAGALRRRVWIDQLIFEWTPNFYIILVGPAGIVTKSSTMALGAELLQRLPDIHFGPDSVTWQALGECLMDAGDVFEYPPGSGTKTIISCATMTISELGTLMKLEDDGLVSMLINMWDGRKEVRPWTHQTRSQKKIEIKNPWLNIIGCTTPTWLRANFPDQIIGGGLTSRIIFVYGDKKSQLVAYPGRRRAALDHADMKAKLIEDLKEIATLEGPYVLTDEAEREFGDEPGKWYHQVQTVRPAHLANSRFDPYVARKQTHLHKLAMVLAAAEDTTKMEITVDHLRKADIILSDVEQDMVKVFESIGMVQEARQRNEIESTLRIKGEMTIEDLWASCYTLMTVREFNEAVTSGVNGGMFEKLPNTKIGSRFSLRLTRPPSP